MTSVSLRPVAADETDLRLDRWFRRHFPELGHGRLQKLLRTGQVRVDGRRAQANARLRAGQTIRVPPIRAAAPMPGMETVRPAPSIDPADAARLRDWILHEDEAVLVLDKPPGLAVQGGTRTARHLDGMLAALGEGRERPRLVHRLDRDTSGVLVVARTAAAAAALTRSFRRHRVEKLYWALVIGRPPADRGTIDRPLAKRGGKGAERVATSDEGRPARTAYRVVAHAGRVASWLALQPLTGRTHQLRTHLAAIGTPILGDQKYGAAAARPRGAPPGLMLHARELRLLHPAGGTLEVTAPPSATLRAGLAWLGFEPERDLPGTTLDGFEAP
jgi:23S rRNA pseudouridine955/2504/2580 synthase